MLDDRGLARHTVNRHDAAPCPHANIGTRGLVVLSDRDTRPVAEHVAGDSAQQCAKLRRSVGGPAHEQFVLKQRLKSLRCDIFGVVDGQVRPMHRESRDRPPVIAQELPPVGVIAAGGQSVDQGMSGLREGHGNQ